MNDTSIANEKKIFARMGVSYRELALHLVYSPENEECVFFATVDMETRIPLNDTQVRIILDEMIANLTQTDIKERA